MSQRNLWRLSVALSTLLIIVLINLWIHMNRYDVPPTQFVNEKAVKDYLKNNFNHSLAEPTIYIKTGIFIQSSQFINSSEMHISGYIWQRYLDGVHDDIKPRRSEVGFVLPDQVNLGRDIAPCEVYRVRSGDEEVIGWYFEATLRLPFDYSHYPFDHKTISVRLRAKDFYRNIVLLPDFSAYPSTGLTDVFGIEKNIVLGAWERQNTYFDYILFSYDLNFGIADYIRQTGFPELHYNFVVKRKFENAFFMYLLPLFIVAILLFAALLTVSTKEKHSNRLGTNPSRFICTCSVLFFVVIFVHIQLREQFDCAYLLYIEYYYILLYTLLAAAASNTYLFSIRPKRWCGLILYEDNIVVKAGYWPVVFGCMVVITLMVM